MKRIIIPTAVAAASLALVPASFAAGRPVSTYYKDGRTTVHEARSEVRDLLADAGMRQSMFRENTTLADGTPTTIDDPFVQSTTYKIDGCKSVSRSAVDCTFGLGAFTTTKPSGSPYRFAMGTIRVSANAKRDGGMTTVTTVTYGGAPEPTV